MTNNDKKEEFKEIKDLIDGLMQLLEENGWELNDDGDIVDKKSKKLVWEIIHGR